MNKPPTNYSQESSYRLPFKLAVAMLLTLGIFGSVNAAHAQDPPGQWQTRAPSGPDRQEVSYVEAGGMFYLAGGGIVHERYDPQNDSWSTVKPLPVDLDHIQGVELGGKIYYIGGLSGWPAPHVSTVYVYDPAANTFAKGASMSAGRGRGAGGVAVYNGKIYYAGGLHDGKAVPWFDVYDPKTNAWARLPDMPTARDHFQAAVVDGSFYAIGGRDSGISINATTPKVDVYDLTNGTGGAWRTPNTKVPTPRGGFATAVLGKEILIIGGEGGGKAYDTVEAYHTANNSWRTLEPMPTARHGIQAAVCEGGVYVAAGGTKQGGGAPTSKQEVFFLGAPAECGSPQDATPPDTNITAGPSEAVVTDSATFEFTSTEANSTFKCKLDGGFFKPCSSPKSYDNLIDGEHTFQVRAIDAAGNKDATPASRSWTVHTVDPEISGVKPAPGAKVRDRTPKIGATVRDDTELAAQHIKLYVDGKAKKFSYDPDTDKLRHASRRLSYGRHAVKVVATDDAGNEAVENWNFKVLKRR